MKKLPLTAAGLLLCIVLLCLSPQFYVLSLHGNLLDWLRYGIAPALLLLTLLLTLSKYPQRSVWFCLPFALLAPQELFYLANYGKTTDAHAMAIIAETDLAEATGYLSGLGWLIIAAVLLILLLFALTTAVLKSLQWQWLRYGRPIVWLLALLSAGWLWQEERQYAVAYPPDSKQDAVQQALSRKPLPESHNLFYRSYPLNLLLAYNEYRLQQATLAEVARQSRDFRFGASQPLVLGQRQIYVLVIGETLRPDRLQLNGYARPTTPQLSAMDDVVSFTDMVSPWAWTRMAVPVLISRKSAQSQAYFFHEKSLVTAFKEAGFRTYWLSTQSPLGVHDSSVALHASEADVVQYLNPIGYKKAGYYDAVLRDAVAKVVANNEQKQLIVLHTLGSHFSYADRYPAEFDQFQPSGRGRVVSMHDRAKRELLNNAYDNSVRYTDYWLSGVLQLLQQQAAISSLLLVSDHGENLFDGDCDKSGHGHNTEYDYRVAALWWGSREFRQHYPQLAAQLAANRQRPFISSQVFHTMLTLADIHYPGQQRELSLSAPWQPTPRVLANGLNFDKAQRVGQCRELQQGQSRPVQ